MRKLEIPVFGNLSDLEAGLRRAGLVAEDASKKISGSFRQAGLAAAEEAAKIGASVDEQAAAAGRAAAAFTEMSAKITTAQRNAGKAAAAAAGEIGASVDEQRAAYLKAIAVQSDYEAAQQKAADAAKRAAAEQAAAAREAAAAQERAAKKMAAAHEAAIASAQKRMSSVGRWTLAGGIGIAGYSVDSAMKLQSSMEQLQTQAGATTKQVQEMTQAVIKMAPSLATGPQALSESLYHAFSATHNMTQALGIMSAAAKEARISGADLTDTTTALTAAVFSGIHGAQNFTQAMGLLNATVGAGDMHFQDLNQAFAGPMLATVKGYGLSLKDVGAALATFGDLNIRGADAATQLRMAVQYMAKPAATAAPLLHKMGLNVHSFADAMANGGLLPALQLLHDRMAKLGIQGNQMAQVIGDLFTKKGASGVTILENAMGRLESKYKAVGHGAAQQNQAWINWNKTLAADMDHLKATVASLADKFGMYLIPKLTAAANAIKDVIHWMQKHQTEAEILAGVIGSVLGTAITVFAYTKAVAFVNATKNMVTGIANVGGKIVSVVPTVLTKLGLIGTTSEATAAVIEGADAQIEAANTTAGGSFTALGADVTAATEGIDAKVATMAATMETSASTIEATNVAIGASFTALLGPIGAATLALAGLYELAKHNLHKPTVTVNGRTLNNPHLVPGAGSAPAGWGAGPRAWRGSGLSLPSASQVNAATGVGGSGTWVGGPVPVPSKGPVWERIVGALRRQGFSDVAISGILGNFAQETGGGTLSGINTADSGTGASGMGGMGLGQWTMGRRQAEIDYAQSHHLSPTSLSAQVGYLVQELRTTFHGTFNRIQNASSAAAAAHIFDLSPALGGYEGGTDPNGIRERVAARVYQALTGTSAGGGLSTKQLDALLNSVGLGGKGSSKTIRTLLYTNPLAGDTYNVERTDQGKDYGSIRGNIGAIGAGIITLAQNLNGFGQTIVERLTQGPNKGRYIYYGLETGATGVGIHSGQMVHAGQTIARGLGTGGVEFGFWNPKTGHAMGYQPGVTSGGVTPAGTVFAQWMAHLAQGNTYLTTHGGITTGGGSNYGYQLVQAMQRLTQAIQRAGQSLLQRYGNIAQTGTVRTASNALGLNTNQLGSLGKSGQWSLETQSISTLLYEVIHKLSPTASLGQVGKATSGLVAQGIAGSQQEKHFEQTVVNLYATGQKNLADRLVAAHKQAMQTLGQLLYANQVEHNAQVLANQTQQLSDQTKAIQDATQAMSQHFSDEKTLMQDQTNAVVQHMQDMQQIVNDRMAAMVQAIQDEATVRSDQSSAVVSAINDQTQIQVDKIGERGLYGLNLITQQLRVNADQVKAYWDRIISGDQLQLDTLKQNANAAEATAKINLDQATAAQNLLVAQAQQTYDTTVMSENAKMAAAQAHVDAEQLKLDTTKVGPAQIAYDMHADSPQSVQKVFQAQLDAITKGVDKTMGGLDKNLANTDLLGTYLIGQAGLNLAGVEGTAKTTIQGYQDTLDNVTGYWNKQIALASSQLSTDQGLGAQAEAGANSAVSISGAQASTQFAGSGAVVNIYGIPADNAAAIGNAVDWVARTQLQTA